MRLLHRDAMIMLSSNANILTAAMDATTVLDIALDQVRSACNKSCPSAVCTPFCVCANNVLLADCSAAGECQPGSATRRRWTVSTVPGGELLLAVAKQAMIVSSRLPPIILQLLLVR